MNIKFPGPTYDFIKYPGGEIETRFKEQFWKELHDSPKITIDARIHTAVDIITLLCLCDSIHGLRSGPEFTLRIPYLPYARNDRRFVDGGSYGLNIFGDLIRLGSFQRYVALDVHNELRALRDITSRLENVDPIRLVARASADFETSFGPATFLFPDAGASKRYQWESAAVTATKERDPITGALTGFTVPTLMEGSNCLIVDDICDGGGTFIGIAEALRKNGFTGKLGLYVTHGIFSQGIAIVKKHFDRIYTTNSFHDFTRMGGANALTVYDAWEALDGR